MILIGTDDGLHELDGGVRFSGQEVTALAGGWVVLRSSTVVHPGGETRTAFSGRPINCIAPTSHGILLGMGDAALERLGDGPVGSFTDVEGRDSWYTPWGGPPDTRSITEAADGTLHVNVHVGGIPRSRDGGKTWEPTIDVDADVHQVLAHPSRAGLVLAAAAVGLCVSRDGGDSYDILTDGLHATYSRAVAIAGDAVLLTVSRSHQGRQAAVYRSSVGLDAAFEKCTQGLPEWFDDNIDTGCLSAAGDVVAFGTAGGDVYVSGDSGSTWGRAASDLPPVRAIAIG